jgi:alcohol dehydrogenase (cytochrome c)
MVKQSLHFRRVAVSTAAVALLGASGVVSAVGVDRLESQLYPNYVTDDMLINADKDQQNWLHYGKDYEMTRYSGLSQINRDNVKSLKPAFNLSFGVLEGQDSQAVAVNGTLYVTTSFNRVIAVNGTTGDILWKYERELPGDVFPKLCCDVVNRGVAVYKNKVYLATLDAHVVALDNQTGDVVWDKKIGDYTYAETFTIMPLAVNNKIVFGTAGAEYGVRGWVAAIDADTGAPVWKTYSIPGPGEPGNDTWGGDSWKYGGGSAWITGSYDKETNQLFWPIGNPGPDFDRHVRPGDNLFSNSTLVLNADSGKIQSYFQYTPNDPYDYDGVNENVLVNLGGKKIWVHGDRNGHLYGIDRANTRRTKHGREHLCVWATPLLVVNWVKQPIDPRENNCRPVFNYPEKDVVYDRVTTNIAPSLDGGKEWHPLSVSLRTKMAYVPVYDFTMDLQAKKMEWKRGEWYLGAKVITFNAGAGQTKAYDAATGALVWSRSQSWPATGGLLTTGGGLAFYGDPDGMFNAVNDETGEHLWAFQVGSGVHGNPTTYTAGGKQYVAIVYGAGGGGIWPLYYANFLKTHTKGGGLMVFTVD